MTPLESVFSVFDDGEHKQQCIKFDEKEEIKMENEKKVYETPEVTKVEFDASDRITASGCGYTAMPGTACNLMG